MLQFLKNLFIFISIIYHSKCINCLTPIVIWHGLGYDHYSDLRQLIRDNIGENVYIKSIQLASNGFEETESTIFLHPDVQISTVCQQITLDENLKNGFHAIGLSQGSQFL